MSSIAFNCKKWADCTCSTASPCACGPSCGCGTVTIAAVTKAMATQCAKADCTCGNSCKCGKGKCTMGGTVDRTLAQWVEYVKANAGSS